jgi:glycosyltransferase involved in cell wall biosynthesis
MPLNYGVERRIREGKFDAVLSIGYARLTNIRAICAANSLKIPVLLRTDSTLYNQPRARLKLALKRLFFAWLKPKISAVLSAGVSNTAYYRHYLGEQFPIFLCRYAVDNLFFQKGCEAAAKTREEFRASLGLEAGRPVILCAAKLRPDKRFDDLLKAFIEVTRSGGVRQAPYLLIVGEGEERAALENLARDANPGDVRFLGFRNQSELPRFYNLCDVFVMPAVYEAWGLVINEVMNAGRAVIVSDEVGGQKDLVQDGVNGCVFRARDVQGLAESLRVVLADERTWQAMGAESLRMIQKFSFAQNVSGLRLALQALVPGFPALPEQ